MSFIFKITTTTSPQTFVIPCVAGGTFNATVDYGDGTGSQTVTAYNDSNLTHSFATAGQHTITIDGTFPNVGFNNNASSRVLVNEVVDLGGVGWTNFYGAFRGCTNLTTFNSGTADTSSVTNMSLMLYNCTSLTTLDLSNFDTSSVTNMSVMFYNCSSLTALDVSGFNTSVVNRMDFMLASCTNLTNLDIKHFDVSSVTNGTNFLSGSNNALTTTQYNELLEAWAAQDVQPNVPWHFGDAKYTNESIADWAANDNGKLSVVGNKLSLINGAAEAANTTTLVTLEIGKSYTLTLDFIKNTNDAIIAFNSASSGGSGTRLSSLSLSSTGSYNVLYTATSTSVYVEFANNSTTINHNSKVDNISLKLT